MGKNAGSATIMTIADSDGEVQIQSTSSVVPVLPRSILRGEPYYIRAIGLIANDSDGAVRCTGGNGCSTDGISNASDVISDASDGIVGDPDVISDAPGGIVDASDGAVDASGAIVRAADVIGNAQDGIPNASDGTADASDGIVNTSDIIALSSDGIVDASDGIANSPDGVICGDSADYPLGFDYIGSTQAPQGPRRTEIESRREVFAAPPRHINDAIDVHSFPPNRTKIESRREVIPAPPPL